MSRHLLIGVDAGGTRSSAMVATADGVIVGRADGGAANYHGVGAERARASLLDVTDRALAAAGATVDSLAWAGFGVAGADRPKDFERVRALLPALGSEARRSLVNDSQLALWAGTPDGVGVAVVSGTGTNAVSRTASGVVANVGGYCHELGDFGAAGDLGREAVRLAMRGREGRSAPTALYDALCAELGLEQLEDLIDYWMAGDPRGEPGRLAPLVFRVAATGDEVARNLLEAAGRELSVGAKVLLEAHHADAASVTVALGGSVLQKGEDPTLVHALAAALRDAHRGAEVRVLTCEPVVGAVLLAHADSGADGASRAAMRSGLERALGGALTRGV